MKPVQHLAWVLPLWLCACGGNTDSTTATSTSPSSVVSPAEATAMPKQCAKQSWVAGTVDLCSGALIYRDYVYDDYGADAGAVSPQTPAVLNLTTRLGKRGSPVATTPGLLSPTAGDQRYPQGLENTADLVQLTLRIQGNQLLVDFELNTMFNSDDALAAIAIDTDNNPATGGGAWTPLKTSSAGWEVLKVFSSGDPDTNHITGSMPLPAGKLWRVQAAVAQKDGTVMNVAFRGPNEQAKADGLGQQFAPGAGNFWEDLQAAALARGDISEFGAVVNVDDLRNGVNKPAEVAPGFHQRVYTSQYTLGEGINMVGVPGQHGDTQMPCEQYFHYLGKYQPYGIYIPKASAKAMPGVQLVMHGCEANHASQINQPNMQQQFGEDLNRILVAPLGRGPHGFYSGISERDVLDVLSDVQTTYPHDQDRVIASGYSMGGYAALRFASLYPDRFAGLVNWVGFTGDVLNTPLPGNALPGLTQNLAAMAPKPLLASGSRLGAAENIIDFIGNLQHVPSANIYGMLDELVQINTSLALAQRFDAVGVPYRFYLHPVAEHLTFMALDNWQKEADASKPWSRIKNPARVLYRTDAGLDNAQYNIRHDKAYWVSSIRARSGGASVVDLNAPACGGQQPVYQTGFIQGLSPVPWVGQQRIQSQTQAVMAANTLTGSLSNVRSLTIDTAAVCLSGKPLQYTLTADGPVDVILNDGRRLSLVAGENKGNL
ncbi:MAG TPA: alpha/beta hydrolase [Limnobacter sp.]|uniref:alpha/beta hydrolase n=1 Tax=Limnobacter sp. TaxID=2003368 RepID=UPI002ED8AD97